MNGVAETNHTMMRIQDHEFLRQDIQRLGILECQSLGHYTWHTQLLSYFAYCRDHVSYPSASMVCPHSQPLGILHLKTKTPCSNIQPDINAVILTALIQPFVIIQSFTARQENLRLDPDTSYRRFHVTCPFHFDGTNFPSTNLIATAVHSKLVAIGVVVVYPWPLLIPPWQPLRLRVAVLFFNAGESCGFSVLAFGLVAFEDG